MTFEVKNHLYNGNIQKKFCQDQILEKNISNKKWIFKNKSDLLWPIMTLSNEKLCLHNVGIKNFLDPGFRKPYS